jgi:hypothetical protein
MQKLFTYHNIFPICLSFSNCLIYFIFFIKTFISSVLQTRKAFYSFFGPCPNMGMAHRTAHPTVHQTNHQTARLVRRPWCSVNISICPFSSADRHIFLVALFLPFWVSNRGEKTDFCLELKGLVAVTEVGR